MFGLVGDTQTGWCSRMEVHTLMSPISSLMTGVTV